MEFGIDLGTGPAGLPGNVTPPARKSGGTVEYDYTRWVVVTDLTNRVLTIRCRCALPV